MAKNFQQNGRPMHQRQGARAAGPYKKPFKPRAGPGAGNNYNQIMFNASQIPDDPGFLDFNNPTPPIAGNGTPTTQVAPQQKKKNKTKPKNKPMQPQQMVQQQQPNGPGGGGGGNWNKNKNLGGGGPITRFNGNGGGFNPNAIMPQRGNRRMGMGPGPRGNMGPGPRGNMGPGPRGNMGPGPMMPPMMPPHGFQPMIPPMPPMGRGPIMPPMGTPPHFLRRSGRGGPMPPMPLPMPPMIPPRMPPMPFNNGAGGKIKKPNIKMVKKVIKGKSSIRTLQNLVNSYPIEKPWVTDEIRAEHDKKVDIENRLKGNKDDDLFAQFKTQRDKFVAMYEAAREEYLKQEAAAVKAKDAKAKQTKNKTATKDTVKKETTPSKNAKA